MRLPVTFTCAAMLTCGLAPGGAGSGSATASTIVPLTQMAVARAAHSATRLADGSVLVVGGCTAHGCEFSGDDGLVAEVYVPSHGRFVSVGRSHELRNSHTATLLADGRVLVAGGWGANAVTASTEIYDPGTKSFSRGPQMLSIRAGASATLLTDGRVLLAGGFTDNRPTIQNAEVFLPRGGTFEPVATMHAPRGAHAAARLQDGRVLIIGGFSRGRVVATTETFDPRTNRFRRRATMRFPRRNAAAVTLADGRVLVVGGAADIDGRRLYRSTEIYDPRRDRFIAGPPMQFVRNKVAGSVLRLPSGGVLVAGGASAVELFDPRTGRFRIEGQLDATRYVLTATPLARGRALLVGGYDASIAPTRQAWLYR